MTAIYTIGYEGAAMADLIATLKLQGVEQLLDVREIAQSRRPGFSKTALSASLSSAGIQYSHYRQLGDPKAGREAAREGKIAEFQAIFSAHLSMPATIAALNDAATVAASAPSVLLCYERSPLNCHRGLVAERLAELCSLSVRHLGVVEHAARRYCFGSEAA